MSAKASWFDVNFAFRNSLKGNCHEQFNMKKTAWTFQVWFKAASMQGKTARIWRVFGGERDHYRQKSRFRERKVSWKRKETFLWKRKEMFLWKRKETFLWKYKEMFPWKRKKNVSMKMHPYYGWMGPGLTLYARRDLYRLHVFQFRQ